MPSSPDRAPSGAWSWLRARPWRTAAAVLVLTLLVVRVAAPFWLERVVEAEATALLGRVVEVGSVDLSLVRGRVGLSRVHAGPLLAEGDVREPLVPETVRLGARRVVLDVSLSDLLSGEVRVEELVVVGPRLLRLRDAAGSLPPLIAAQVETEPEPEDAAPRPPFSVDRLRLTAIRFFYFDAAEPDRVPLELGVEELVIDDVALGAGELMIGRVDIGEPSIRVLSDFEAGELEDDVARAAPPKPAAEGAEALPVRIGELTLRDASLSFLDDLTQSELATKLAVRATDVTFASGASFPVEATLDAAGGRVALRGVAGFGPARFDGSVGWKDLALASIAQSVAADDGLRVKGGTSEGELDASLRLGEGARLRLSGTASVRDFAASEPKRIDVQFAALDLGVGSVSLDLAEERPAEIVLSSLVLRDPKLAVSRVASDVAAADDAPTSSPPRVRVAKLDVSGGEIRFEDATVKPAHRSVLDEVSIQGAGLRWPEGRADSLRVDARSAEDGQIHAETRGSGANDIDLVLTGVALPGFSPYIADAAGYWVDQGSADLEARVQFDEGRTVVDSDLVLRKLAVTSVNPETFEARIGMSLDVALALLRDPLGAIRIPVDFTLEGESGRVDFASLLLASLRQALIGALSAPLKGAGFLLARGDGERASPGLAPIAFAPGEQRLPDAVDLRALVDLLDARPGLALRLRGGSAEEDRAGIAQQILAARLAADEELPPVEAGMLQRRRLEGAVSARGRGEAVDLSSEDSQVLDAWLQGVQVDDEARARFARGRAEVVQAAITAAAGVDAERVKLGEVLEGVAGVGIELVPVKR